MEKHSRWKALLVIFLLMLMHTAGVGQIIQCPLFEIKKQLEMFLGLDWSLSSPVTVTIWI